LLSRYPEQGLSIAILCNAGETGDRVMFARRIFDLFVPTTAGANAGISAPTAGADGSSVDGPDLDSKAGLFFSERTGEPVRLVVDNGRMRIQGGRPLDAVSKDRFRNPRSALAIMSQDEFELHFLSHDAFELKSMEGTTTRYRRARPHAPTAEDLELLAGRYANDETRAVIQTTPGAQAIMVRINDSPAPGFDFRPVDPDTFQRGGMFLRFRRDTAGKVVGLDYSNPVVRNIRFTRLDECSSAR
jgi:hypothetical protein